jgi:hypothetical protein
LSICGGRWVRPPNNSAHARSNPVLEAIKDTFNCGCLWYVFFLPVLVLFVFGVGGPLAALVALVCVVLIIMGKAISNGRQRKDQEREQERQRAMRRFHQQGDVGRPEDGPA